MAGSSSNFLGLEGERDSFEKSRAVILPVPYDATATYRSGSREGPRAIVEASRNLELYDDELALDTSRIGIHTAPGLEVSASGPGEMVSRVMERVSGLLRDGKFVVTLGGDHILSAGSVFAHAERFPGLSVLQLDAHADLRDSYEGTPYSHACTMRRISEKVPYVGVGIRSLSAEEAEYASRKRIQLHYARHGLDERVMERIVGGLAERVYVTIDMDVFDPSQVPAVGTPEPGGMDWYSVNGLLSFVAARRDIVGFDVMELCPIPGMVASDFLAAKLIYRFLGHVHRGDPALHGRAAVTDVREREG